MRGGRELFKLKGKKPKGVIEVKRFYLAGTIIEGTCPNCGEHIKHDLGDQYLSYPAMNTPFKESVYCEECDEEVEVTLQLNVSVDIKQ